MILCGTFIIFVYIVIKMYVYFSVSFSYIAVSDACF